VGARRPRRNQLFTENRGVPARDANQITNDIQAEARESWDLRDRTLQGKPGVVYQQMPVPADCAGKVLGFDATGTQPTCTTPSSSVTLELSANSVTNPLLAQMPEHTIKCNPTGVTANAQDCTAGTVTPMLSQFTDSIPGLVPPPGVGTATSLVFLRGDRQWTSSLSPSPPILTVLTSGMTGVFTPAVGVLFIAVEMCGGGGGGSGSTAVVIPAAPGTSSTIGYSTVSNASLYIEAGGGPPGKLDAITLYRSHVLSGSAAGSQPEVFITGSPGGMGQDIFGGTAAAGGTGSASPFGGAGPGGVLGGGIAADVNSCSGGGGSGDAAGFIWGGGGGAGAYVEKILTQPLSASYPFAVGEGGRGGTGSASNGGRGGGGTITFWQFFQ